MSENVNNNVVVDEEESAFDFRQLWTLFLVNWHWFVISVIACVIVAGAYLWFTPTKLSVSGKMQIIDKSKQSGGMSAGMAMLNSLPMGLGSSLGGSLGGSLGIDAEMEILKSNTLIRNVVNDLDLHTEYRLSKWGKKTLLYKNQPVNVSLDKAHMQWFDNELPLTYHQFLLTISKDSKGYTVETTIKENKEETDLPDQTFATLPATIKTEAGTLTITENQFLTPKEREGYANGYTLKVSIIPSTTAADGFVSRLNMEPPSKKVVNIINITLEDENLIRGIDFVNHLVDAYNQRANDEKNEEARKTDEFVNERLAKIDGELGTSDAAWEEYKTKFQITSPEVDATDVMTKRGGYEAKLVEIGTKIQLQDYLNEYVNDPANLYEIIPSSDSLAIVSRHNSLITQRKELLKSVSPQSPAVQRLDQSIEELHPTILLAMQRYRQALLIQRQTVEREYNKYNSRVTSAPQQERVLTEIGRQREIKQGVYLLMLQKREETAMELANTKDKGKLIDEVRADVGSTKPQKKMVLLVALFLGALLPLGILYLLQMLKSKIDTKADLSTITSRPVIGEIRLNNSEETIRNLRTGLLLQLKEGQKVILVASDADGDGKTFIAKNLSESLTAIGKKVLSLNLDLRQSNQSVHPADYLASKDFADKIEAAKAEYDYVVIDSPSLSKYADAYQIGQFADATIFVVKSEKTEKSVVESLNNETRLPNIMLIINAIDMSKKKFKYIYKNASLVLLSFLLLTSCMSTKKVPYFQNKDQFNSDISKGLYDAKIMPKDVLQIKVFSMTPTAADIFNLEKGPTSVSSSSTSTTNASSVYNYLVDNDGTIYFPVIGKIQLGGLTKVEAESLIKSKITPYMADKEDFFVHVRMINYKYSVIGEVKSPGVFTTQNEKVNIIEAIAQAGDLTLYGERDKVYVIRENSDGQKQFHQMNLNDANIINSPFYYLQQNDIIYVEPNKAQARSSYFSTQTSMWFSITSALMSISTFILAITK